MITERYDFDIYLYNDAGRSKSGHNLLTKVPTAEVTGPISFTIAKKSIYK